MLESHKQILPRGSGRIQSSFNLALVGSLHLATDGAGATSSGVRAKNPAMKSSTMKGAKALESKLWLETVPNREKLSLAGKGTLLVSCPRNRRLGLRKLCPAGRQGHRAMARRLVLLATSPSWRTPSPNREGPLLPLAVGRCLAGNEVLQRQRTGRVVQVGAAVGQNWPSAGETAARQWQDRSSARVAPSAATTTKERTGRTRHQ